MAGGGPSTLVFGNSENPIDLIRTFETEITQAFAQDALNIIKERTVEMAPNYERSAGNENSIVSNVGNYVTNLYALIFQGSATQYNSAPGMGETLASYRRRIRALKNRWNNWANEATTANENFIQDVILHIRNTSYYLWIYFIFMQAIELYAIRRILQLVPGTLENREDTDEGEGEGDGSGDAAAADSGASGTITRYRESLERAAESMAGSRARTATRTITYLLIIALLEDWLKLLDLI